MTVLDISHFSALKCLFSKIRKAMHSIPMILRRSSCWHWNWNGKRQSETSRVVSFLSNLEARNRQRMLFALSCFSQNESVIFRCISSVEYYDVQGRQRRNYRVDWFIIMFFDKFVKMLHHFESEKSLSFCKVKVKAVDQLHNLNWMTKY